MNEPRFHDFRKPKRSDGGSNCVEVADAVDGGAVRVRDSKDRTGPVLEFTGAGWLAFIGGARNGRFDLNA